MALTKGRAKPSIAVVKGMKGISNRAVTSIKRGSARGEKTDVVIIKRGGWVPYFDKNAGADTAATKKLKKKHGLHANDVIYLDQMDAEMA